MSRNDDILEAIHCDPEVSAPVADQSELLPCAWIVRYRTDDGWRRGKRNPQTIAAEHVNRFLAYQESKA